MELFLPEMLLLGEPGGFEQCQSQAHLIITPYLALESIEAIIGLLYAL